MKKMIIVLILICVQQSFDVFAMQPPAANTGRSSVTLPELAPKLSKPAPKPFFVKDLPINLPLIPQLKFLTARAIWFAEQEKLDFLTNIDDLRHLIDSVPSEATKQLKQYAVGIYAQENIIYDPNANDGQSHMTFDTVKQKAFGYACLSRLGDMSKNGMMFFTPRERLQILLLSLKERKDINEARFWHRHQLLDFKDSFFSWPILVSLIDTKPCFETQRLLNFFIKEAQADVNARGDNKGGTLLIIAAEKNFSEYITQLLKLGADLEATNDNNQTAAHVALQLAKVDSFKALADAGANLAFKCDTQKQKPFEYLQSEIEEDRAYNRQRNVFYAEILRILRIKKEKDQKK
jgi:hypothetical protein